VLRLVRRQGMSALNSDEYTDETVLPLLNQAKSYLRTQLQRQAPDSVLTEAWDEFYRVYSGLIRRFVAAHGVSDSDIDDCCQDVWNKVAIKLPSFERSENRPGLRSWLYTVVRSKSIDLLRRNSRRSSVRLADVVSERQEPEGREVDPAVQYERTWEDAFIQSMLTELRSHVSALNYQVVQRRLLDGCSVADVAKELSLSSEQVRYRQYRTLRKLQTMVAVYSGAQFGESGDLDRKRL